jgi:hypothetical protein
MNGTPSTPTQTGRLHCHKFDRWVAVEDAACIRPEDYCERREQCGIYFLMTERKRAEKKRDKEERDASV